MKKMICNQSIGILMLGLLCVFAALPQQASAQNGAQAKYKTTDVIIGDGWCEVQGYFTNEGDMAAEVYDIELTVKVKKNDKVIYTVVKKFDIGRFYVWNGAPHRSFTIYDSRFKKEHNYTGDNEYGWTVSMNLWWYNVKPIGM